MNFNINFVNKQLIN